MSSFTGEVLFKREKVANSEDLWDDTALIQAYDEAVNTIKNKLQERGVKDVCAKRPVAKKKAKKAKKSEKTYTVDAGEDTTMQSNYSHWQLGDRCLAVYSEDGQTYEAVVVNIDPSTETCFVRYLGYDNEEEQYLADLLPEPSAKPTTPSARGARRSSRTSTQNESGSECGLSAEEGHVHPCGCPSPRSSRISHRSGAPSWHGTPATHTPPPPPPLLPPRLGAGPARFLGSLSMGADERQALHNMLISWYMSGYHTGYYQGVRSRDAKKKQKHRQQSSP